MSEGGQRCDEAVQLADKLEKWVFAKIPHDPTLEALVRAKLILVDSYTLFAASVSDYHRKIKGRHVCVDDVFKEALLRIKALEQDCEPLWVHVSSQPPQPVEQVFTVEGIPHVWED
jgi:hypothetical protein